MDRSPFEFGFRAVSVFGQRTSASMLPAARESAQLAGPGLTKIDDFPASRLSQTDEVDLHVDIAGPCPNALVKGAADKSQSDGTNERETGTRTATARIGEWFFVIVGETGMHQRQNAMRP
ncbi:hypothetical protein C9I57_00450 [Trinickia symbiotica]|uniref:Uncharacterized protein n=1 Tax=Trinickia symbiotica TaxID=863227 RepID=A0A2T3Y0L9_9BURK|nr:hypothetical protein C9I57_00450 [Trinickia symbiotica]